MFVIVASLLIRRRVVAVGMPAGIVMPQRHAQAGTRRSESLEGHRQRQGAGEGELN
jgi:hypothetical protein